MFRSTGSYEPDRAETVILLKWKTFRSTGSYEPDLLGYGLPDWSLVFRSTGSYEPDRINRYINIVSKTVSIHRLLRA